MVSHVTQVLASRRCLRLRRWRHDDVIAYRRLLWPSTSASDHEWTERAPNSDVHQQRAIDRRRLQSWLQLCYWSAALIIVVVVVVVRDINVAVVINE